MKHCELCNTLLPVDAQYCGNCGNKLNDRYATKTDFDILLADNISLPQTPPLSSSPQYPDMQGFRIGWQDSDPSFQTRWDVENMQYVNPQFMQRISDEDEDDAVVPNLLLPGVLAIHDQMPSPAQAPMVQGTPQFGGVPSV
ncbi:MAG TPA: zinc ribbon domain-containing protein, partial [Ktedonobacteraceae bacterium]|nr:zinc ribbon domain-containing protein [Ktedonobacteraceae bacterium]